MVLQFFDVIGEYMHQASFVSVAESWNILSDPGPVVKQFEKERGKISTIIKLGRIAIKTEWSETVPGEFPITEWRTFPLEIPATGFKKYILGQFPGGLKTDPVEEDLEVIHLPVYVGEDICDARIFEEAPDAGRIEAMAKVPVMTIGTQACGECSCTGVQTQSLSVVPVWRDSTSIVLELEWYEGNPMEGGINPEWYIQASPKLSVKEGLEKLKKSSKPSPIAEKCCYCLYVNPVSLGTHVLGEGKELSCSSPGKIWRRRWKFDTHEKLLDAINRLSEALSQFSK